MRTYPMFLALLIPQLFACGDDERSPKPSDLPDLSVALAPGETRAGVVSTSSPLFAGISAEGQVGDIKIYNHQVRFIIQGVRDGSYIAHQGGNLIDADIVRPPDQPGRDMIDEWQAMAGFGRLLQAHSVTVVNDGQKGDAVVVAEGWESPFDLINGALEGNLIPDLGLKIRTEYRLPADSWFLEVTTTVTATDGDASFQPGDVIQGAQEGTQTWAPGVGYQPTDSRALGWRGLIGKQNEQAYGLFALPGQETEPGGLQAISSLIDLVSSFEDAITLSEGESHSWTRLYGVGPDPATLTDAWLSRGDETTETVSGTVTSDDGPVAGARVTVSVDGEPWTLAVTDEQGEFEADIPAGSSHTVHAHGRGRGVFTDGPEGAGHYSLYAGEAPTQRTLKAFADGAPPIPFAQARGVGTESSPLNLVVPGTVHISVSDAQPFAARLERTEPEPAVDEALVPPRETSYPAAGWSRDGSLSLLVEPGSYTLVVHRGARYTHHSEPITVEAGGDTHIEANLERAIEHPGYLFGDPHSHAGPSPDSTVPIAERLVETAADGVQLHFATDHDHIADFRPLLEPLGIGGSLNTVVATEMSPVARGHLNCYPLHPTNGLPNHGAFPWWREPVETTTEEFTLLRDRYGGPLSEDDGFVLAVNHPIDVGLADLAGWSPGVIGDPDYWASDFDAMEVMNAGSYDEYLPLYLDLVARGHHVTPVGVTDSHSLFGGAPGLNGTYIGLGVDQPEDYTDDLLRAAYLARNTIVSRGLFLELSIPPGSVQVGDQSLEVTAKGAWVQADRLHLYVNDRLDQTVEAASHTFELSPDRDAFYVVIAEGDTPMSPVYSSTPWAMASAIFIDENGDGWTAPKPPLTLTGSE